MFTHTHTGLVSVEMDRTSLLVRTLNLTAMALHLRPSQTGLLWTMERLMNLEMLLDAL